MDIITYALAKKLAGGGGGRTDIFYFCTPSQVDADGKPKIQSPDEHKIYFTPNGEAAPNQYAEWVYKNGAWEKFGDMEIDLSDYVKNTDYANASSGGVVKTSDSYSTTITSNGALLGTVKSSTGYASGSNQMFISKGTLENLAETWTFTLADGTEITKKVFLSPT